MTSLSRYASALFFSSSFLFPSYCQESTQANVVKYAALAEQKKLAYDRQWLLLGHYQKSIFGSYKSEIDGPEFFLSKDGKRDPQSELEASLEAMFAPAAQDGGADRHFLCSYPARAKWLQDSLEIPKRLLPVVACERFDYWYRTIDAYSATLVFAAYYVNNPASMFGHTFLRLDRDDREDKHHLLSYSINFAADTGDDNGLLFMFLGLAGGYPGKYSTIPYYVKTQQYSNIESRDLWEYKLDLSPQEVRFLLMHLWELGRTYNDYYFFDENCAYQMLSILEVARPTLSLREKISPYFVPPSDTVKAMDATKGLIENLSYRPSRLKTVQARLSRLTFKEKNVLANVLETQSTEIVNTRLTPQRSAEVLDAAIELLAYRNQLPTRTEFQKQILIDRSNFPATADLEVKPTDGAPHLGHKAARLAVGGGMYDRDHFYEINYRPEYHDLMSYDLGYPKSSEIIAMDLTGRYYQRANKLTLEDATIVRIFSLFPVRRFIWKPSWSVSFGFETLHDNDCDRCLVGYLRGGPGLAFHTGAEQLLFYTMADLSAEFGPWNKTGYRVGPRTESGVVWSPVNVYRMKLSGKYSWSPTSDVSHLTDVSLEQRISFTKDLDVRIAGTLGQRRKEAKATIGMYF